MIAPAAKLSDRIQGFTERTSRWIVAAAIISVAAGAVLSHVIEPGVRVEKLMLTSNTPALRIFPATPGPHPKAVLAHGAGGSKEMLFRFGEAFAAAGFDCYSVDQAGHGESPQPFSIINLGTKFPELERALGGVDVFLGHSMGGGAGARSVRKFGFRPKLFIALGSAVNLGKHGPPLVLLFSRFDEFRPLIATWLKAQTNAQVVYSSWSEHITEAYDSGLVKAGVKAACAAVGKPVPTAPTAWRWRLVGLLLGITGALGLMFCLPEIHPRLARLRGVIVPGVLLLAVVLTLWPWLGVSPQPRRIPVQLVIMGVVWLALVGARRLRLPRWSLPVVTGILAIGFEAVAIAKDVALLEFVFGMFALSTLLLLPAMAVGTIATRGGLRRDGDIAMAIFAGCVIGQFMPFFY
jgi:pimeloyl-ACP methyl ester carboxylesterase